MSTETQDDELNWPSADILVGYNPIDNRIIYSCVSTGRVLREWDVINERFVYIWTPTWWDRLVGSLHRWVNHL